MFNVLLVDDEPWVLEGLKTMVNWNRYGFQICGEALSAPEALRLIEELRPELVMTDIHMPVLNGLELIERSNRMLRKPPKFVVLSGYDDFGYAHEAMRQRVTEYLLKPIDDEEIEDMLSKLSSVIRDEHAAELTSRKRHQIAANYMMNLLLQGGDRTDVTEQACKALNIQPEEKLQCVLVRGVLMQEHLVEQLRYQFPEFICCFQDNRGEMAAVLRYDPSNQEELLEAANRLQHELSRAGEEAAIITISVGAQGMHALGERYRHAEAVAAYKMNQGKSGVFQVSDRDGAIPGRGLRHRRIAAIYAGILSGHTADVHSNVMWYFSAASDALIDLSLIRSDVADLELMLCRKITEIDGDADDFMHGLQEDFGQLGDIQDYGYLHKYMSHLAAEAMAFFAAMEKQNEFNTIYQVTQYVDREFRSKLQLQDLAQHFHMNSTYLGQLFKKHAGKPFKEYLNDKRIEEAKLLLKRSGMKVSDIALHVGFPNSDYFIHKFKTTTGVLPSVFKNQAE